MSPRTIVTKLSQQEDSEAQYPFRPISKDTNDIMVLDRQDFDLILIWREFDFGKM